MNTLSYPEIVGYMSTDSNRTYSKDLSQLKFIKHIKNYKVPMDLNHNVDAAIKRTTDDNNEKISLLLKFILDNQLLCDRLRGNTDVSKSIFICYRRTLIAVMCSVFSKLDSWRVMATLFKGCIYLCSIETDNDIKRRHERTDYEKKCCAWGYKFEQYILSDHPNCNPDINRPVIENEEFSLIYHTFLAKHELLYGAQIDGMIVTETAVPPETKDPKVVLNYLKQQHYLELKTNRCIQNRKQEYNLKKFKLLRCWCQCYLAALKGLLMGFRDDDGIIHSIEYMSTDEIKVYCQNEWNQDTALGYLNYFMSFVKTQLKEYIRKKYNNENCLNAEEPLSMMFENYGNYEIRATEVTNDESLNILPQWYIEGFNKMCQ